MAKGDGKSLERLYIELGLDLSQLQADFLAADKSVTENLGRLNRQQNSIKLRVAADVAGLDAFADKSKILETQERGLNQQLALAKDKLAILDAAYRQVANNQNSSAMAVQRAEQAYQKARLEVANLEQALKSLSAQRITLDTSQLQDNISKLNARIQHVKIQADIDTGKLQGANAAFDAQKIHIAAVTKELELQRQKLIQLQAQMYKSAQANGAGSSQTLNIKSNVLQQVQEIQRLQTKLKELQSTNVSLQIRADSIRQAEQNIHDNIARINARIEHIKVKTDIDVSKLGAAASEFDKAKAHLQGLNRELDLQNQKLAEMRKALGTSVSTNGLNSVKTIGLQTEIQKQIQLIDQLKAKLDEMNKIAPTKTNSFLSGYLNIKGDVTGKLNSLTTAFSNLKGATSSADNAITAALGVIGEIPSPVGKAVAAFAALPVVILGIENSLLNLAKSTVAAGDSFYVMSRGMQLSIAEMGQLSTIAKVTGIDINEVNSALRRFSMQMTKSGDENTLAAKTLKRYGAEIYDANGRIKNAIELSGELGKALKAAEAEGNGAAFRDIIGGKFWSADFITYLEDFADNVEQAKKVVKNGLANPTWAHAIQGEINTLDAQTAQLGGAFSAALMPVVAEIVPEMQRQFGELTKVIAANKDNIKFLGDAMAVPVRMMKEFTSAFINLSVAIDAAKDKGTALGKMFETIGKYRDDIAALMNVAPTTALTSLFSPVPMDITVIAYRDEIEEFKKARAEAEEAAKAKNEERQRRIESSLGLGGLNEAQMQKIEALDEERIKREQETADIIYKIHHNAYENSLYDLKRWQEEQLKIIEETEAELQKLAGEDKTVTLDDARNALAENVAAKQLQIEQEKETKLAEIRQRISLADATEAEKRMAAIETEKNSWIQAGMEIAEAEQLAEQQKASYIRDINQKLSNEILAINQNELQRKLSQIEREKQAWIDKGASVAQAEELAQAKIQQANQETEKKLNQIRRSVASADQSALENKLAAIDEEKEAWIQAGMEIAEAEELAQRKRQQVVEDTNAAIADAAQKYAGDVAKAYDDAAKKTEASFEEAARKNEALRNDALNVLKQEANEFAVFMKDGYAGLQKLLYGKLIKSGVNPDQLKQMTPERLAEYQAAKKEATRSFLPNWEDPYSGTVYKAQLPEMPAILQNTSKGLDATATAADKAAESLNNLAEATSGIAGNGAAGIAEDTGGAVAAYRQEDGSVLIQNKYDDYQLPTNEFDELSTAVQNATTTLNDLPTAVQGITQENPFADFGEDLQVTIQQFDAVNSSVEEVTVRLSDLSTALANFTLPNGDSASAEQRVPVNVNTSVQIDEAHAWDSEHIQELAERVADVLLPQIVSAIGGDGNSY